jgi:hypothetical protein
MHLAILACQTELKTYMIRAAEMELEVVNKKYCAVFHQVLKGFTQPQLINKGVGPQQPLAVLINFNFTNNETLFLVYKAANNDNLPAWNLGNTRPSFLDEYATNRGTIICLLHDTVIKG